MERSLLKDTDEFLFVKRMIVESCYNETKKLQRSFHEREFVLTLDEIRHWDECYAKMELLTYLFPEFVVEQSKIQS